MKHILLIICSLIALESLAQTKESTLARMNDIKRDTATFIYGVGNMPTVEQARSEALNELSNQLSVYLKGRQFAFFSNLESIPAEAIHYIDYSKRPNQYRVLAYVSKVDLVERDKELTTVFENMHKRILEGFVDDLANAKTQEEVERLILGCDAADYIQYGLLTPDTEQTCVDNGYLVYLERKTGKVLEIMTPKDEFGNRKNAGTGSPTNTMNYKSLPIMWIYISGQNMGYRK